MMLVLNVFAKQDGEEIQEHLNTVSLLVKKLVGQIVMLNQTNLFLQTMLFVVRNINDGEEVVSTTPQSPPDDRLTRCYEPYGCFSTLYPWTDVNRPISNLPEEPYKINTNFCLYTRRNPHTCQVLETNNPMSVYRSNLARSDITYFIAHGYLEGGHKPWIGRLTGELLKNREANVVVVDWRGGSNPPYTQAVANIRVVGVITAHLVNQLLNMGVRPERIHFIGHSLGAHLGGYVGHNLQRQFHSKLGRITGLDPAEPHFGDTLPVVRLDYTDAEFVDIIHTDTSRFITGGLGMREPIGHVDFYPNGGVEQPGCDEGMKDYISMESGSLFGGLRRFLSCNHLRSYEYFIHSINANSSTAFMAAECPSWKAFQNGTCFSCSNDVQTLTGGGYGIKRRSVEVPAVRDQPPLCTKMGFHADAYLKVSFEGRTIHAQPMRKHVQLFLMTGAEKPFWKHHYRVQFQVSCSEESLNHNGEVGIPRIILHGDQGTTESMPLIKRQQYFGPGSMHWMTVAGANVGVIKNVTMEWEYNMSFINILSWRIITSPRIYLAWVNVESLEIGDSLTVCPPEGKPVISGISKKMVHCTKEIVECSKKD